MSANQKRQDIISFAMYQNKINKRQLSKLLDFSYPTMLSKLKDTGTLKLSEADRLCNCLNINIADFIEPIIINPLNNINNE